LHGLREFEHLITERRPEVGVVWTIDAFGV
jgi:hypothetical protein